MDPLQKVYEAFDSNLLPNYEFNLINKRFSLVLEGIARIEKASGIRFPIAYIEPSIILSSATNSFDYGILFARTIPVFSKKIYTNYYSNLCSTCSIWIKGYNSCNPCS